MNESIWSEKLIGLPEATKWLRQKLPEGAKKPHISTVRRWITKGVGGKHLEATRVGNGLFTSVGAIQRFCEMKKQDQPEIIKAELSADRSQVTVSLRDRLRSEGSEGSKG